MRGRILIVIAPLLAGASIREVAQMDGANLQAPSWSPDGTQLAFEANFHDKKTIALYVGDGETFSQVHTANRATSELTAGFSTKNAGGVAHELTWAPASVGRFLYSASSDNFDYDLYISGGGAVAKAEGADGGAAWSPDGRHIAFTSARTGEGDLYLIEVANIERAPRQLTRPRTSSELHVSWSPQSDELVFVGHSRTGDNIWLIPGLESAAVQLTTWRGNQIHPRYSPVDRQVAFYANKEDPARFDLYVMAAKGRSEPKQMLTGVVPDPRGPAWTPDGKHILAVVDDDDAFDPISAVNVTSGAVTRLSLETVGHGGIDVTERDGTPWIAYIAQGAARDAQRDFKRLYAGPLDGLP